jgi:hypothetical protein
MSTASYVILGHAIAHEIGHVLLGSSEHSSSGLMRAQWNQANWHLASAGLLTFLPEQTERMREEVSRFRAPDSFSRARVDTRLFLVKQLFSLKTSR